MSDHDPLDEDIEVCPIGDQVYISIVGPFGELADRLLTPSQAWQLACRLQGVASEIVKWNPDKEH